MTDNTKAYCKICRKSSSFVSYVRKTISIITQGIKNPLRLPPKNQSILTYTVTDKKVEVHLKTMSTTVIPEKMFESTATCFMVNKAAPNSEIMWILDDVIGN